MKDVAVLAGPDLFFATPVKTGGRPVLLATLDAGGRLSFPASGDGQFVTVALPGIDATDAQIARAVQIGAAGLPADVARNRCLPAGGPAFISVVAMSDMGKWGSVKPRRLPFMFDLVVVPAASLGPDLAKLAARAKETQNEQPAPIFGENLEKRPEIWSRQAGWKFTPAGAARLRRRHRA